MKFILQPQVYELGVRGVYFNIRSMSNLPSSDPRVTDLVAAELAAIPADMETSAVLTGFHSLHAAVSKKPRKLLASPAVLLAFFRAKGDIPRINGIVDVYNAISVASGLAIGAHDLSRVVGDVHLRLTNGEESFWPLGSSVPAKVHPGEYAYIDSANDVLCRLEVRQVEKTKISPESQDVFFIVQSHSATPGHLIEAAAGKLANACRSLFGGQLELLYPKDAAIEEWDYANAQ